MCTDRSGGGLVAAVLALQDTDGSPTIDESLAAALRVNAYCRDRGTARFHLRDPLARELDALLGDTAATRLNDREASVSIAVTRFSPWPSGEIVQTFDDGLDLKLALLATSCIPFYFAASPVVVFRQWPAVDGFFAVPRQYFGVSATTDTDTHTSPRRLPPYPKRRRRCGSAPSKPLESASLVRVFFCDEPRMSAPGETISPRPGDGPAFRDLFACALGAPPVDDDFLLRLFDLGQKDATRWLAEGGVDRLLAAD